MQIIVTRTLAAVAVAAITLLGLGACSDSGPTEAQKQKRANYDAAAKKVPFPQAAIKNPLERENTAEKLKRDSDPNRLSYVYLLSLDGKVVAHYVVKGKVSSADSQLLPTQELQRPCDLNECWQVLDAAGDDATYGAREPGVFFFTPDDTMITWSGDYIQSDRPMKVETPISLVAETK